MGWFDGKVNGEPAKVKEEASRTEALYNFRPGGDKDHVVSTDGINAAYLREGGKVIVDDSLPDNAYPEK